MWSRKTLLIGVCLLTLSSSILGERVRYENYGFYEITPKLVKDVDFLKDIKSGSDSIIFLDEIHVVDKNITVIVAPHKKPDFELALKNHEIPFEVLEQNFQKLLDEEIEENDRGKTRAITYAEGDYYDWTYYPTLDETYDWMINLAAEYPNVVKILDGGVTYERRHILGIRISLDRGKIKNKPGILLEGGIHAREWISPSVVTYITNQLLNSNNTAIRELADKYNWYIFPHTNPDGYVYTHTTDRLWRKTRTPYGKCFGADPNRNWDFHWGEVGVVLNDTCDLAYGGPRAFSEIETYSFAKYLATLKGKIQLYVAFHSYSQFLLFPYGYTSAKPPNHADLNQVFKVAVEAVGKRYGTNYTGGSIYNAIYPAAGTSMDWGYGKLGIKMAFTYELRPKAKSTNGFILPASQIIPTCKETTDSIIAMVNEVERLGYFKIPVKKST